MISSPKKRRLQNAGKFKASSCSSGLGTFLGAVRPAVGMDALPYLRTVDGDLGIDFEAEAHFPATDFEYRDLEHVFKAVGAADDHGFLVFPRQDQHDETSFFQDCSLCPLPCQASAAM